MLLVNPTCELLKSFWTDVKKKSLYCISDNLDNDVLDPLVHAVIFLV